MNSHSCTRCIGFMLALLTAGSAACRDSTPIGSVECIGEQIRCGVTEKRKDPQAPVLDTPHEEILSTGLEVLMPVWSGHPFEDTPDYAPLVADANAVLWRVSLRDARVKLAKLDREGVLVEEHTIEPPNGTQDPASLHATLTSVTPAGADSSMTIVVQWTRTCDARPGEPVECLSFNEALVFQDLEGAPRRISPEFPLGQVQANASGLWLLDGNTPHIDKLDASAGLVWRQTGLLTIESDNQSWQLRGALRPADELGVLLWADQAGPVVGLDLWKLSATGSIDTRQSIAWSGDYPAYAIDVRGRDVIVGANRDGDLTLMRVLSDGKAAGNLLVREEYVALKPDGFALDSEGAAYVATEAGGREPNQLRELLCQLPDSGPTRCFTLAEISATKPSPLIDDLVVSEPGVVYVRSGAALRRYELPPAAQ
jgi:hypothetical protein